MVKFTLYIANCRGEKGNCLYPNKVVVSDKESLIIATSKDHVTAKYKGNYRSNDNFLCSDCIPLDCDNDFSDREEDWILPLDLAMEIPGVSFAVVYSKSHMKAKGDKSERPRFHVFFPISEVTDSKVYTELKKKIAFSFPYFDANALDSARFLYGTENSQVEIYEGDKSILDYINETDFAEFDRSLEEIHEGNRNSTMSHIAGKVIKRYGASDEAHDIFLQKAELCNPPLSDEELDVIWKSASKFGRKLEKQEGYISPEQYNSDCKLKPNDFSDVGQATVLAMEYKDILRYSPSTDYMVYNGSFWEESKPKSQGVSQDLTERQLAEAETEMKKAIDELVKNGGMEILASVGAKKAVQMFNKQQAHAYEMYEDASVYKKYAIKRRDTKSIAATLKEARPMLEVEQRNLDADEFMLNTPTLTYVWRCVSRVLKKKSKIDCPARTMEEKDIQYAVVTAVNDAFYNKSKVSQILKKNIESVIFDDIEAKIDEVDKELESLQNELVRTPYNEQVSDSLGEKIINLRKERQAVLTEASERKELKIRMQEMIDFLDKQQIIITEYNDTLTRRLVENITIYDEKVVVTLRSGIKMEVEV